MATYAIQKNEIGEYELLEVLDLRQVVKWADKASAKSAAQALGLKTWRYVKIQFLVYNYYVKKMTIIRTQV